MESNVTTPTIKVVESIENRQNWINRDFISKPLRDSLSKCDILFVPIEVRTVQVDLVFHQGTDELLRFIQKRLPTDIIADICIEDDEYKSLDYHSETFHLSPIITTSVALPVLLNIVSQWIFEQIKGKLRKPKVIFDLTIEDNDRSIACHYEGDSTGLSQILTSIESFKRGCD
jgi:hypothetical protein